jgi:hypothetical protein
MEPHVERHCTFSSSQIWKLVTEDRKGGFGAPAKKYIKQVGYEIKLGRAINKENNSKPTSWGSLVEKMAFYHLPIDYELISKQRLFHKEIKYWSGAPDLVKPLTVSDVKCPFSLEVFCDKIESLNDVEVYKNEFPEDYWQHISNAILLEQNGFKVKYFEAIIYVPYRSELPTIREMASNYDGDQNKIAWINWAQDEDLPFVIDGGYYKNLNVIRFEISQHDKYFLTDKVFEAGKITELNAQKTTITYNRGTKKVHWR